MRTYFIVEKKPEKGIWLPVRNGDEFFLTDDLDTAYNLAAEEKDFEDYLCKSFTPTAMTSGRKPVKVRVRKVEF